MYPALGLPSGLSSYFPFPMEPSALACSNPTAACVLGVPAHGFYLPGSASQPQIGGLGSVFACEGFPAQGCAGSIAQQLCPEPAGRVHCSLPKHHPTGPTAVLGSAAQDVSCPTQAVQHQGAVVPAWIPSLLSTTFFTPCDKHKHLKKTECTFFCATCSTRTSGLCQHCMADHQGHQVIQVRRYVYCDVIRALDINQYMDTAGVQCYIINQAKVMFLNPRPQSRLGYPMAPDTCRTCSRHLREGAAYCCLACKVKALLAGDAWTPPAGLDTSSDDEAGKEDASLHARASTTCKPAPQPADRGSRAPGSGSCSSSSEACAMPGVSKASRMMPPGAGPATLALLQAIGGSDEEVEQEEVDDTPSCKRARYKQGSSSPAAPKPAAAGNGHGTSDSDEPSAVTAACLNTQRSMVSTCSRRKQNSPRKSPGT